MEILFVRNFLAFYITVGYNFSSCYHLFISHYRILLHLHWKEKLLQKMRKKLNKWRTSRNIRLMKENNGDRSKHTARLVLKFFVNSIMVPTNATNQFLPAGLKRSSGHSIMCYANCWLSPPEWRNFLNYVYNAYSCKWTQENIIIIYRFSPVESNHRDGPTGHKDTNGIVP